MKQEFEVSIMVKADAGATVDQLKLAVSEMLRRAVRLPVDRRFDWSRAHVAADRYTANGKAA